MNIRPNHRRAAALLCVLLVGVPSLRANYIREAGGTLTTDLPGVSISSVASAPGTEAWDLTFAFGTVWATITIPDYLAEPSSEPGKVNQFDVIGPNAIRWTSDVPLPVGATPFPNGAPFNWFTVTGQQVSVTFEDLGDAPQPPSVPDSGGTIALAGLSWLCLAGARRFVASH